MTAYRLSLLVRWSLIACMLLLIFKVATELISYPAVVSTAGIQALIYLIPFVLAMLVYSWLILFRTRASTQAQFIALRVGTFWGLFCGAAWVIELLVANVLVLQWEWLHLVLYDGSALTGYFLPGLASLLAAWRSRRIVAGLQAGLLCGIFGGLAIFLASLVLSPLFLHAGLHDPQTIREFERSGLPDITTYVVGDYLAGMIAHLWIGLVTGFFLGVLGGAVGKALTLPEGG
jgi:hypothetical protein